MELPCGPLCAPNQDGANIRFPPIADISMRRRTDKLRQFACEFGRGSEACVEAESTVPKARSIFFQSREPGSALLSPGFRYLVLQTFIAFRPELARLWSKLPWGSGAGGLRACTPRI